MDGRPAAFASRLSALGLLAACAAGLLAGCSSAALPTATVARGPGGPLRVGLQWDPSPPVARRSLTLRLRVTTTDGASWKGGPVTAQLSMQGMSMPAIPGERATLALVAPGVYRGRLMVVMAGRWTMQIRLLEHGAALTASVPVEVSE